MLGSARIATRELSRLCRRLATALEAGLDVRRVFDREAQGHAPARLRSRLEQLRLEVSRGQTLSDALAQTGEYFPPLFREMVDVGEETGQLAEVFRQLAEHYENQLRLQRVFMAALAWPLFQFTAAVFTVGLLIWVLGVIGSATGTPIDILGFGLMGERGALIWFGLVGAVVMAVLVVIQSSRRGGALSHLVDRLVVRVPVLGPSLKTLALSRLAWTLQLTLETGMPLKRALPLCLRSTRYPMFTSREHEIVNAVSRGQEISEALAATNVFPRDFIDTIEVGERSGRLPESMAILSRQYQDQAQRALATLTVLAGFAVWAFVAAMIIALIFRIAMFYIGTINEAVRMTEPGAR